MTRSAKDQLVKARVSQEMKDAVAAAAEERDISEGLVVREALNLYFKRQAPRTTEEPTRVYRETITPAEAKRRERAEKSRPRSAKKK